MFEFEFNNRQTTFAYQNEKNGITENTNYSTPMTSRSVSLVCYEEEILNSATFQGLVIHSSETRVTEVSTGLVASHRCPLCWSYLKM